MRSSIGFNPPALIGIPGSPIFQWPVGRPPGSWVINPGYWGEVRPTTREFEAEELEHLRSEMTELEEHLAELK